MKIGVITLFGLSNYGNRLQNLAVTELLQRKGYEVETIVCEKITFSKIVKKIKRYILFSSKEATRYRNFNAFNKRYIRVRHILSQSLKMPSWVDNNYDAFVVGSDQVWNPRIRQKERDTFFLKFTSKDKRICISPSIGASHIEDQYLDAYIDGLNGFHRLCCREEQGSEEIRRITGKDCLTVLDPTLALDAEYWRSISNVDGLPRNNYLLCIFIGSPNKQVWDSIVEFASDHQLKIVNLLNPDCPFYTKGPAYFVSLIEHAKIVFTDSFHAVSFSIIFNTPFYVFDRLISNQYGKINSRLTSLLHILCLSERYLGTTVSTYNLVCDFKKTNEALNEQRHIFDDYLSSCFSTMND